MLNISYKNDQNWQTAVPSRESPKIVDSKENSVTIPFLGLELGAASKLKRTRSWVFFLCPCPGVPRCRPTSHLSWRLLPPTSNFPNRTSHGFSRSRVVNIAGTQSTKSLFIQHPPPTTLAYKYLHWKQTCFFHFKFQQAVVLQGGVGFFFARPRGFQGLFLSSHCDFNLFLTFYGNCMLAFFE